MGALNREKLLAAKIEVPSEKVDCPELGGSLIVRGMTGKEQSAFLKALRKKVDGGKVIVDEENFNARLIVACLVDEKGTRILTDDEFNIVQSWPGSVFQKLAAAAQRLNGYSSGN
jgi:hypothetical protein